MERTFALYSPAVDTIKVIRSGKVKRAKLYYLRDRTGKSARITEKIKKKIGIDLETKIKEVTEENVAAQDVKKDENKSSEALKVDTKIKTEAPKVEAKKEDAKPNDKTETKNNKEPKK